MRALVMFGALLGLGLGLQVACHGNCADTGSHCCAGSHCNCAGAHCNCADDPGSHDPHCLAAPAKFECTVTWLDEAGDEIGDDAFLYENFESSMAVVDTCNALQADNPDRPDEAVSGSCACERIDWDAPAKIASPS
jgi:hypothetical protein